MTVPSQAVRSCRSSPQSKALSTTTPRGVSGAESRSSGSGVGWPSASTSMADLQRGRVDRSGHTLSVRVEQQLGRVEAMPVRRRPRARDAVAVVLAGSDVGQVGVPDIVRALRQTDAPLASVAVEQDQLDARGVLAEEGEVGALPVPGRPQRIRRAAPDAHGHATKRSIASSGSQVQSGRKFAS